MSFSAVEQQPISPGHALRIARTARQFRLVDVSERTGLDQGTLSRLETGRLPISGPIAARLGEAIFSSETGASR